MQVLFPWKSFPFSFSTQFKAQKSACRTIGKRFPQNILFYPIPVRNIFKREPFHYSSSNSSADSTS